VRGDNVGKREVWYGLRRRCVRGRVGCWDGGLLFTDVEKLDQLIEGWGAVCGIDIHRGFHAMVKLLLDSALG
jgi:hypothetical protein